MKNGEEGINEYQRLKDVLNHQPSWKKDADLTRLTSKIIIYSTSCSYRCGETMNIQQLYNEYKKELERARLLDGQMSEYYINVLKPKGIVSYNINQLSSEHDTYKQMNEERRHCHIKYNQLAKDIADKLDGKIFKLSNGRYITYDDNPENGEHTIREYEEYVP